LRVPGSNRVIAVTIACLAPFGSEVGSASVIFDQLATQVLAMPRPFLTDWIGV